MQLSFLATLLQTEVKEADVEITQVTQSLNQVQAGSLFVAIKGKHLDGHTLVQQALAKGAVACLVQQDLAACHNRRLIRVQDTRHSLAKVAAALAGNPQAKLKLIGVTGSCGKTTVSSLLKQLLTGAGHPSGLVGTVQNWNGTVATDACYTTPLPEQLYPMLAQMVQNRCSHCVLEASSQALDQERLFDLPFALGIFTNFGRDHLDDHGDEAAYFAAKCKLFRRCQMALLCADDPALQALAPQLTMPTFTFGLKPRACDFWAEDIRHIGQGVAFLCCHGRAKQPVFFPQPGLFSVQNALAAIAAGVLLGVDFVTACRLTAGFLPPPGRMERLARWLPFGVYRDFAHTPQSLEQALKALRPRTKGRLLVLFGCGGCRDQGKRPQMGKIAEALADLVFLTSDNPRAEDPVEIIRQVQAGMTKSPKVTMICDRKQAIEAALNTAKPGDVLLLAGKGHETTQIVGDLVLPLDEKSYVESWRPKAAL